MKRSLCKVAAKAELLGEGSASEAEQFLEVVESALGIDAYKKRIRILEQALWFYGNPAHYDDRGEYWAIVVDEGKTARDAIKKGKEAK